MLHLSQIWSIFSFRLAPGIWLVKEYASFRPSSPSRAWQRSQQQLLILNDWCNPSLIDNRCKLSNPGTASGIFHIISCAWISCTVKHVFFISTVLLYSGNVKLLVTKAHRGDLDDAYKVHPWLRSSGLQHLFSYEVQNLVLHLLVWFLHKFDCLSFIINGLN
jgi:hypothetical protein